VDIGGLLGAQRLERSFYGGYSRSLRATGTGSCGRRPRILREEKIPINIERFSNLHEGKAAYLSISYTNAWSLLRLLFLASRHLYKPSYYVIVGLSLPPKLFKHLLVSFDIWM